MSEVGEIPMEERLASAINEAARLRAELAAAREAFCFIGNIAHAEGDTAGICDHVVAALARIDAALKGDGDE